MEKTVDHSQYLDRLTQEVAGLTALVTNLTDDMVYLRTEFCKLEKKLERQTRTTGGADRGKKEQGSDDDYFQKESRTREVRSDRDDRGGERDRKRRSRSRSRSRSRRRSPAATNSYAPKRPRYSHTQCVHVNNLRSLGCDDEREYKKRIRDILGKYGEIVDIFIGSNGKWGKVTFSTADERDHCLNDYENREGAIACAPQEPPKFK